MKTKRAFSLGFAALLALVAVIGFAACSDDGSDSSGSAPSEFVGTWKVTSGNYNEGETLTINSDGSWSASNVHMDGAPSGTNLYSEYDSASGYLYLYISAPGYDVFDCGYCYLEDSTLIWIDDEDDPEDAMTMTKQ